MPTKKPPNPSAATALSASASRGAPVVAGSEGWTRVARKTPASAAAIPANWSPSGRSPVAIATITGTAAAPLAETGETTLIVPIASAR